MTIRLPKSVKENLRFLCVEVDSQVANLQAFFLSPTTARARRILDRSGYAYNLKARIHSACINTLACQDKRGNDSLTLRGAELIATDLDRIAELCRGSVKEMDYVEEFSCIQPNRYQSLLDSVRSGIKLVEPAIKANNTRQALQLGKLVEKMDKAYKKLLGDYVSALKKGERTEDLTRALFVAQRVREMGDVLLRISESIISANIGQPVNYERFFSLQSMVSELDTDDDLHVEPIAETRSGSAISGIAPARGENDDYIAIFKDGIKSKVKEERQGVKSWHEIYPGLAPKILSYEKRGESAALLIEHLSGYTFEHILVNEDALLLKETLKQLGKTLNSVWRETCTNEQALAGYMQQLEKRMPEVYKIHPEFIQSTQSICGQKMPSFQSLVRQAEQLEKKLPAPFSVYIHGDFNVDNIIYDPIGNRVNFIDLHRSRYMDYVQDVSVFMVSNYRLQILDAAARERILRAALDFYQIARRFARRKKDETFELRLALGLARSFITSTRFILDKSLARSMFLRARYLLGLVLSAEHVKPARFKIPLKEIFVD
ncbi:MAG: hypothetical protein CSA52_02370 [Gammaproteobacteria bacterium]|nr:MAG: hypothetical protein CSB48_06355 [Pseudomonadota bacterium]PIE38434.1 MAG: hypothetical protein CSA52_02370 [Gammaproteobacteria bacterium]